jgi:glutamine amidotransferase
MAGALESGSVLAAVRSATPPNPAEESGAAPFTAGPWLWSVNGAVSSDVTALRRSVPLRRASGIEGSSDSEVLFALLLDRLDSGSDPATALVDLLAIPGRLNLLLTDGSTIWATAWGDTLWTRSWAGGVVVASEPFDDDQGWATVPDRSLVVAADGHCCVKGL